MNELQERQWLRRHALFAPFGIFAVTALLVVRSGQWDGWKSLETAASLVDLAAVLYAMVAVLAERGVNMVFWALERKREREKETNDKIRARVVAELLDYVSPQSKQELEEWARDKGIPLDKAPRR